MIWKENNLKESINHKINYSDSFERQIGLRERQPEIREHGCIC